MAVSPPFVINETKPASTDLISQHPADERSFRDTVESWLTLISDPTTGLLRPTAFGTGGLVLTSIDAGAGSGPLLTLFRDSPSPADADALGHIRFDGRDSTNASQIYAGIYAIASDVTAGTEDGTMNFYVSVAGVATTKLAINADGASIVGALSLTTPLAVSEGGTGGSTAAAARTNLGLGTMATQNSNNVSITGGSVQASTVRGTTLYTNQNIQSDTVHIVLGGTGGGVYLRPNGVGSSAGEARVDSSGTLVATNDLIAGDTVYAGNGAAAFQSNGDINSALWGNWGNNSAFLAIENRINTRVGPVTASLGAAAIGTYAFCSYNGGAQLNPGTAVSGNNLTWANADGDEGSFVGPSTWTCMGFVPAGASGNSRVTLFKRAS